MIRKCIISIEEVEKILKPIVMDNLTINKKGFTQGKRIVPLEVEIAGERIYALSDRYKTFFVKGYTCPVCGITGQYFALEREEFGTNNSNRFHLNLYAVNQNGEEVLMTKDHIIPKSLGGKNELENYQPMCVICNVDKGNTLSVTKNNEYYFPERSKQLGLVLQYKDKFYRFDNYKNEVIWCNTAREGKKFYNNNAIRKFNKILDDGFLTDIKDDCHFVSLSDLHNKEG